MAKGCEGCDRGDSLDFEFTMAFQPIVDIGSKRIFGHEALVRGLEGEGARSVLDRVTVSNRYAFDQQCRVKAIELAAQLFTDQETMLSINFMPNAVYEPRACIRLTLASAEKFEFPLQKIIFEFTENEEIDPEHVLDILKNYHDIGFKTAIDDFGAGHAGLALLTKLQPDIVKLDMDLIRGIDRDPVKRTIVKHTLSMLAELGIAPICEGIETAGELSVLEDLGVSLMQGYYLAKPAFQSLATPRGL